MNRNDIVHAHSEKLITIGRIIKARGLSGELSVEQLSDFPERYALLNDIKLEFKNGEIKSFKLERARISGSIVYIKLTGIDDRDAADSLKGAYLNITADDVYPLENDSYYIFELEGLDVFDLKGEKIGKILRIERYPAHDVLVMVTETKEIMIPAVKSFIKEVNIPECKIIVDMPEGLPSYHKGSL